MGAWETWLGTVIWDRVVHKLSLLYVQTYRAGKYRELVLDIDYVSQLIVMYISSLHRPNETLPH